MEFQKLTPRWLIKTQMGNYFGFETLNDVDHGYLATQTTINNGCYPAPVEVIFNCPYILERYTGQPIPVVPVLIKVVAISPIWTLPPILVSEGSES